jgi:hypothetical protein
MKISKDKMGLEILTKMTEHYCWQLPMKARIEIVRFRPKEVRESHKMQQS